MAHRIASTAILLSIAVEKVHYQNARYTLPQHAQLINVKCITKSGRVSTDTNVTTNNAVDFLVQS